jgi:uncharacterized protein YdbL (DUF1318 family)
MKSVKMFGKKILIVFLATLLLVSTAAIAVPVNAATETQTVTGSTIIGYIVTATVPFGAVGPSTTATMSDVITASSGGNTITVTLAAQSGGTVDTLEELRYIAGTVPGTLDPDLPLTIWNEALLTYPLVATITLDAGAKLSMEAVTGIAGGTWGTITITVEVT